jgi:hypothetical protein
MIFFSIKFLFYIFVIVFSVYGVMSFNSKFITKKEKFTEDSKNGSDIVVDDDDEGSSEELDDDVIKKSTQPTSSVRSSLDGSVTSTKSTSSVLSQEMIGELSTKIEDNFKILKESLTKQMDSTKEIIDNSIKEFIQQDTVESPHKKEPVKKATLPSVRSFESEEMVSDVEASDDEASEDESEEDYTETFQDPLLYEGVTSPYCLNCYAI